MRVVVMLYEYHFTHSYRPESVFFSGETGQWSHESGWRQRGGTGRDWTSTSSMLFALLLSSLALGGPERLE